MNNLKILFRVFVSFLCAQVVLVASASVGQAGIGDVSPDELTRSPNVFDKVMIFAGSDGELSRPPLQLAFADDVTNGIVNEIRRGAKQCSSLGGAYRAECLGDVFSRASGLAGRRPDYSGASSELRKLGRNLKKIAGKYHDRKAPKAKLGRKSYKAVAKDALRKANRESAQAIEEAVTKLLRSAGNSQKRKTHYTTIANAVNSTKKILRS